MIWKVLLPVYSILLECVSTILQCFPNGSVEFNWAKLRCPDANKIHEKKHYILVHASSVGEFKCIEPLISLINAIHPEIRFVATLVSVDAYERLKDSSSNVNFYPSPLDSRRAVRRFFGDTKPMAVFVSGLDLWPVFLDYLIQKDIPYWFLNVDPHPRSGLKKLHLHLFKIAMAHAHGISYTTAPSDNIYVRYNANIKISGDMRIQRLIESSTHPEENKLMAIANQSNNLIMGSFEPKDLDVYLHLRRHNAALPIVIVPHQPESLGKEIEKRLLHPNTHIIKEYGILSQLYRQASHAYIGGGYDKGVHNVIEALRFYMPILIGPKYRKNTVVSNLVSEGLITAINNTTDIIKFMDISLQKEHHNRIKAFFSTHNQAIEKTWNWVNKRDLFSFSLSSQ